MIVVGTERVLMKESWQAAFLCLPPARMTGRVSVCPARVKLVRRGGYITELLLRILIEDAVWAGCLLALILGSVSGP